MRAVLYAGSWIWTSENSPSRDCLKIPDKPHFGLPRVLRTEPETPFRLLACHRTQRLKRPLAIFQTVSLETVWKFRISAFWAPTSGQNGATSAISPPSVPPTQTLEESPPAIFQTVSPGTSVNKLGYGRSFSFRDTATTPPEMKVNTPTEPMAQESPNVSAMIPAVRAPTA